MFLFSILFFQKKIQTIFLLLVWTSNVSEPAIVLVRLLKISDSRCWCYSCDQYIKFPKDEIRLILCYYSQWLSK